MRRHLSARQRYKAVGRNFGGKPALDPPSLKLPLHSIERVTSDTLNRGKVEPSQQVLDLDASAALARVVDEGQKFVADRIRIDC
mgnify:CR=1 FL=1